MAPRFFRHGELQLVVLALLASRPMHGYELMGELGRLFGPRYSPSAGGVYPAIESLIAEGLLDRRPEAGRTTFVLTDIGHGALAERADMVSHVEARTGVAFAPSDSIGAVIDGFTSRLRRAAVGVSPESLKELLDLALKSVREMASPSAPTIATTTTRRRA